MTESHRESEAPTDPSGIPQAHDVLAAEEFGIGTRHNRYPSDPSGNPKPHDVLAADEFAIPAAGGPGPAGVVKRAAQPKLWLPVLALVAAAVLLGVLRRRS